MGGPATPGPPGDGDGAHLRASDADREAALVRLREASVDGRLTVEELAERAERVHESRTHGDLEAVVGDLGVPAAVRITAPAPPPPPARPTEVHRTRFAFARHRGRRSLAARSRFVVMCGNLHLDLNEVLIPGPEADVEVHAVLGWVQVVVPEGVDVRFVGDGVLTNREIHLRHAVIPPGAPVVRIHVSGFLGSVSVRARARVRRR